LAPPAVSPSAPRLTPPSASPDTPSFELASRAAAATPASRRTELDGLRVSAILLLHLFHVGMMFNRWGWHLKNPQALPALEPPMEFLHYVRMPLLMVIAGAATAFALERRGATAFLRDRVKRLLLPLVFGMLVIVPPQIYIERVATGAFHGSYLAFYPQVFAFRPYPEGAFSWHHLWFVAYLFVYSVGLLPLLARLRSPLRLPPAALCLAFLPLAGVHLWLRRYPETHALVDDPRTLLYYAVLFVYGHLLGRSPEAWRWLRARRRHLALALAALSAVMLPPNEWPAPFEHLGAFAFVWAVILTALAWAPSWFPRRTPRLASAQELAYPFYILHQTVILLVGWALLHLPAPLLPAGAWPRFGLVLVASFLATWAGCELFSRARWLRPLLGMAPRAAAAPRV
jgi:peptidoglycan/LPS O-acetylase OafA/YrhL